MKTYKPTSAGRRGMSGYDFSELTPGKAPEKSLLKQPSVSGGRNDYRPDRFPAPWWRPQAPLGHAFKRNKLGVPAKVASESSNPTAPAGMALLHYAHGDELHPRAGPGGRYGDLASSGRCQAGNSLPLRQIPTGTAIHDVELQIGGEASWLVPAGSPPSSWPKRATGRPFVCLW